MSNTPDYHRKVRPVVLHSDQGAIIASIRCSICCAGEEWRIASKAPPPDVIHRKFIVMGWALKRKPICPACKSPKKEPKPMTAPTPPKPQLGLVDQTRVSADVDKLRRNKRLVIIALEDYYDDAKRRYRAGHTDETVGKELHLAPVFVQQIREEFYGKMAEPSELTQLRKDLDDLQAMTAALEIRIEAIAKKNGWAA